MDGPMSNVDPDSVDQEVGNIWRNLYKLEKGFNEVPSPKKIASKVKNKVEEFKEYMPLVQTLFNPGMFDSYKKDRKEKNNVLESPVKIIVNFK